MCLVLVIYFCIPQILGIRFYSQQKQILFTWMPLVTCTFIRLFWTFLKKKLVLVITCNLASNLITMTTWKLRATNNDSATYVNLRSLSYSKLIDNSFYIRKGKAICCILIRGACIGEVESGTYPILELFTFARWQ